MDERAVVAAQLGRQPRSPIDVVARCHLALPTVIAVPPHLDDGTPFPTRYWLTCPLAVRRIGRIESQGGVQAASDRIESDATFAARHDAAMERYAADRDALIAEDAPRYLPSGGVGGAARGVKCLHAHFADHAAANDNPVGEDTAARILPLDCESACVVETAETAIRNPEWREPRR